MGFSIDPELYDADITDMGICDGICDGEGVDESALQQFAHYRFDEGMTVDRAAERLGVDLRVAETMEHQVLRMGRPVL